MRFRSKETRRSGTFYLSAESNNNLSGRETSGNFRESDRNQISPKTSQNSSSLKACACKHLRSSSKIKDCTNQEDTGYAHPMSHMIVSSIFHTGSMVPFSLRILRAELPQYMGRPRDALDSLYELQRTCAQVLRNLRGNRMEDGGQGDMTPANRMGEY